LIDIVIFGAKAPRCINMSEEEVKEENLGVVYQKEDKGEEK